MGEAPAPAGQARVAFPPPPPRQATYSLRGSVVLFCEMGVKISTPHGGAARAPRGDEYSWRAVDVGSLGPAGGIIFTSTEACWPRPVSQPVAFWRGLCRVQEQLLLSPSGRVQGAAHPARAGPSDRWSRPVRAEETEIADTVCLT